MDNEKNSVLIVDDEEINLDILHEILSLEYTVYTAKGGVSALELTDKYLPDLIIMDIIMPDMNGFEVLTALKSFEKTRHIPVIVITALNSVEDEEKGLKLGAVDFITKPFSNTAVKTRVENHIKIVNQFHALERYAHSMQHTLLDRLEAIANTYNGLIWSIDNTGLITYFNGQHFKKTAITPSFLIGKNIDVLRAKHNQFVENALKTFESGSQNWIGESNGVIFRTHTTLTHDNEGNVTGVAGSSDDVTELIKLQHDLEAAVETAETANNAKSSFLAKMSHEIRTPLNAILGIAEIQLQDENLPPDEKEVFARIFNSGNLLLGIINDILDMSKIEAGKLELMQEKYDFANLINDTVYLNVIKYEDKPINFILNVDENVPSELFGDELRIKQILNNFLSNAFKYTKEGEVELTINAEKFEDSSTEESADGVTLVFLIRDTGSGMTPEQVDRLFDEYARFNMQANRTTTGTGLGMSIAQNLVRMMKGEILIKSELDKGSLFTVRLPQGTTGSSVLGKETAQRLKQFRSMHAAKHDKQHIERGHIPSGKVLVVDDLDMNLYVVKGMLSLYGLQIDTAASGPEAIEKIKANTYDLVFMDHMMPVMDGVEATREVRKLGPEYEKLTIIALTANAVSGMKEMFLANGFNDFLSKPVVIQKLDAILKEWIPQEKITQREKTETPGADESCDGFIKSIEKTGEFNIEIGLNQVMGDKKMYRNTLEIFYEKLIPVCDDMTAFVDAKDMENFAVSVHSMKTMLATIGVTPLSETALALERAAENKDINFCAWRFWEFKEKLLSLREKLAAVFSGTPPDSAQPSSKEEKAPAVSPAAGAKKPITGKVLLVDDTKMVLYVVKEKLSSYGLQVDEAASGAEAVEKVKGNSYDLVFMDYKMPKMNGIEATKKIRKLGSKYEKLPVIALSANEDAGMEEMFLANGFDGFLSKPVKNESLEKIFEKCLSRKGADAPAQ